MVGGGMLNGLGTALIVGLISFAVVVVIGVYSVCSVCNFVYIKFYGETFESKNLINPSFRLETDGKNIDTVYIYKTGE